MQEKNKQVETVFVPPQVLAETYQMGGRFSTREPAMQNIPYDGILFAIQFENQEWVSNFTADAGKPFEQSLAKRLLSDEKMQEHIGIRTGIIRKNNNGERMACFDYYLVFTNQESSLFQPTVTTPISTARNVESRVAVEILFVFDEELYLPVVKHYHISAGPEQRGMKLSTADIMRDILDEVREYRFRGFLEQCECPNLEDGKLYICSKNGYHTTLDADSELMDSDDYDEYIASIRIIELEETIH